MSREKPLHQVSLQGLICFSVTALSVLICVYAGCVNADEIVQNTVESYLQTNQAAGNKPNSLIQQNSPYLLQHAYNPVQWYAWGEDAFEQARRQNKPIFLSIGYSTCYWCHVMAHESFENEKLAAILKPGSATIQSTFHEHSFTLRSSDFKFRVRLTIRDRVAKDADSLAFRIGFHNLNHDGNPGSAVELQHGNSGYIWIESGNEVTHTTDAHHHFILRDANKVQIADIVLMPPSKQDL